MIASGKLVRMCRKRVEPVAAIRGIEYGTCRFACAVDRAECVQCCYPHGSPGKPDCFQIPLAGTFLLSVS